MDAVILAGGLGTRLRPVVGDRPKALAPIGGVPFIEYQLRQLKRHGVYHVVLCLGYGGEQIEEHVGRGGRFGLRIRCSYEPEPLGTAGALHQAASLITTVNFLVLNGDVLFDIDLQALTVEHLRRKARATIALARVEDTQRYGSVQVDAQDAIVQFLEKGRAGAGLINGGLYVFRSDVLARIAPDRPVSLEYEVFPQLIGQGFYGLPFDGPFTDIGVPEAYQRAQETLRRLQAAGG